MLIYYAYFSKYEIMLFLEGLSCNLSVSCLLSPILLLYWSFSSVRDPPYSISHFMYCYSSSRIIYTSVHAHRNMCIHNTMVHLYFCWFLWLFHIVYSHYSHLKSWYFESQMRKQCRAPLCGSGLLHLAIEFFY